MTEIKENTIDIPAPIRRFVLHWGEMGQVWGVNRSVSQIHALLYVSAAPLTADDIADQLTLARSNISTSLKELLSWGLIRRVQLLGDRRDYFEAEVDIFEMVRRIAKGRKAREIDPTLDVLRVCAEEAAKDRRIPREARKRLCDMRDVVETVDKGFNAVMRLPPPLFRKLIKMGSAITRLVQAKKRVKARSHNQQEA